WVEHQHSIKDAGRWRQREANRKKPGASQSNYAKENGRANSGRRRGVTQPTEINSDHDQRGDEDHDFRQEGGKQLRVVHSPPFFRRLAKSGEERAGLIRSSNRPGCKPINKAMPIRTAAPNRSGIEI